MPVESEILITALVAVEGILAVAAQVPSVASHLTH